MRVRCAHLARQRLGDILAALVVLGQDGAQQVQPVLAGRAGIRRKRCLRRCHRPVDVLRTADGDLGERLFGGRIDHIDQGGLQRRDPGPVHVVLPFVFHAVVLQTEIGRRSRARRPVRYIRMDMAIGKPPHLNKGDFP